MKILFVASEAVPFAKTGGLADVGYALPKALLELGHDVRVVMPKYKSIIDNHAEALTFIQSGNVAMNWRTPYAGLFEAQYEGVKYYFIDNEAFFKRDGYYGYFDDGERFSYFCKAVLDMVCQDVFVPDIIHLNDWHTAPIALLLKDDLYKNGHLGKVKTVFTIHNLKYQGIFPKNMLADFYGISDQYLTPEGIEFNGNINFMKMGIVMADSVTTVSKTYADEIKYPYFGEHLEGVIATRQVTGIVNGLDYNLNDPATDDAIFENYTAQNAYVKKRKNKMMLQRLLRLKNDPNIPMVAMVTRLVEHKGIDLVVHIASELVDLGVQLVILGTGDKRYEEALMSIDSYHPEMMSANIYFDSVMASRIYASADLFLMPSLIEPCGIGQLIAMHYGTIPVVRQTGGLMDTVEPYNKFEDSGTGFGFMNANAHEMLFTIKEALEVYRDKPKWQGLIERAMATDVSWQQSAKAYQALYQSIMN
ncbi:MAG: glycogen synthase GlgA [Clostridiales bacterium]|nr:MAG: glycogen synthase GlgA [Clostridiales bacterium]